jgi:hypothetical protein
MKARGKLFFNLNEFLWLEASEKLLKSSKRMGGIWTDKMDLTSNLNILLKKG